MAETLQNSIISIYKTIPENARWGIYADTTFAPDPLVNVNSDETFQAASMNKSAIAYVLDKMGTPLGHEVQIEPDDKRDGNGVLRSFPDGYRLLLGEVVSRALSESDNTAARIMTRMAGGPIKVNEVLHDNGFEKTHLQPMEAYDAARDVRSRYEYGTTTPKESALLFRELLGNDHLRDALMHGSFSEGLVSNIVPTPPEPARLGRHIAYVAHRAKVSLPTSFYDQLLKARHWPATPLPRKEGIYDTSLHHVALIGGVVVAAFSVSPVELGNRRTAEQHYDANNILARIGNCVLAYSQM